MSVIIISNASGGGGGMVDSVTAGDDSIVIGGTASEPTVETGTLDQIAALHPPVAAMAMNGQKITGLANGVASTDAATVGQISGGSGTVTSVTAADTSIVISGTPTVTPAVATNTLDVIAAQHPPAANWSNNSKKITSLANGSGAQDAAAYGQTLGGGNLAPLTTEGDLLYANATPAPARLAIGAANTSVQSNGTLPSWQPAIALLATTGINGYTLVNGTGNIITWTAPNDGNLHRVMVLASLTVTSATTGGQISISFTAPGGGVGGPTIFNASLSAATRAPSSPTTVVIEANTTISVSQTSAMSAGAAVLWAEIWGS
jgi:trimeric autotransporter adhesin